MAVNRGQLAADLRNWTDRSDVASGDIFSSLLRMVEARIKRVIRLRDQDASRELIITSLYTDLPEDFLRIRSLTVDSQLDRQLDYYPPDALRKSPIWVNRSSFASGTPTAYTVEGNQLLFAPPPDADSPITVTLIYVAAYQSLADMGNEGSNYLLRDAYDVYLWGVLHAAAVHLEDGELELKYDQLFQQAVADLNRSENRARFPRGAALRTVGTPREVV